MVAIDIVDIHQTELEKCNIWKDGFSIVKRVFRLLTSARNALIIHILVTLGIALLIMPEPPFSGDPANIVRRATAISQGAFPLIYPDPPLRYPPISALIYIFSPLDISPSWITLIFTIVVEFVIVPVTFYLMLKEWLSETALVLSLYISAFFMYITYPWANTALQMSFWMYAYPLPFVFLSFRHANRETPRDNILAGVALGIVALHQFFIAGVAALAIAIMRWKSSRSVIRIAITSILTSSPLIFYFNRHYQYFVGSSVERAGGDITISILEILAVILFTIVGPVTIAVWYRYPRVRSHFNIPYHLVVYAVLTVGGTIAFSVLDSQWVRVTLSYVSKYSIYPMIGLLLTGIIRYMSSETDYLMFSVD